MSTINLYTSRIWVVIFRFIFVCVFRELLPSNWVPGEISRKLSSCVGQFSADYPRCPVGETKKKYIKLLFDLSDDNESENGEFSDMIRLRENIGNLYRKYVEISFIILYKSMK